MLVDARLAARAGVPLLILLVVGVGSGCGSGSDPKPTSLRLTAPADAAVVHEGNVLVRGRVAPEGASVQVVGRPVTVSGSDFSARVPLREGANVIDVGASASGRLPEWRALRITRRTLVTVPDVSGDSRDDAVNALSAVGLSPRVHENHGILDELLPGGWGVCKTRPEAGAHLTRGARVLLTVSKTC
jgi:glucodextranase-like protein/PASTA domain-containing protein